MNAMHGTGGPLTCISAGERARIVSLSGGTETERRLSDMGLALGSEVEVLVGGGRSALLVAVGPNRMAIEPDLAVHIGVVPAPSHGRHRHGRHRRREGRRWMR